MFEHNPDVNKNWKPKLGKRIYKCDECGTERIIETNHTGTTWASQCHGSCKNIMYPHTLRETVSRKHTVHRYVREAS